MNNSIEPANKDDSRRPSLSRTCSVVQDTVALKEIFENQRLNIILGWGAGHLLPTDRPRFTNRAGDVEMSFDEVELPEGWVWTSEWMIERSYTECDEDGWSYATDFPRFKAHLQRGKSSIKKLGASVRRRRWIRTLARSTASC